MRRYCFQANSRLALVFRKVGALVDLLIGKAVALSDVFGDVFDSVFYLDVEGPVCDFPNRVRFGAFQRAHDMGER